MSDTTDKDAKQVSSHDSAGAAPSGDPVGHADASKEQPAQTEIASTVNADILLATNDWDQRLAEARAKREKALASKTTKPKSAKAKQPAFVQDMAFLHDAPKAGVAAAEAPNPLGIDDGTPDADITFAPAATQPPQVETPQVPAAAVQAPPKRAISLVTAGVFGVGVGLSLGVVLMAGVSRLYQPAPPETASVQAPPVSPLQETALQEDTVVVSRAAIAPLPAAVRATPLPAPDMASSVATQQALFDAGSVPTLVTALDVTPQRQTVVARALTPDMLSLAAAAPSTFVAQTTVLPFDVALASLAIEMAPAQASSDGTPIHMPGIRSGSNDWATSVPVLFDDQTGDGATAASDPLPILGAAPLRISAAIGTAELKQPQPALPFVSLASLHHSDTQPQNAALTRVAPKPQRDALPYVGPAPERAPTLAEMLGISGDRALDVQLYVHAPTSIGQDDLDTTLGTYSDTGFGIAKVNRENFKISRTHIRYYARQDEKYARALADDLGLQARSFVRGSAEPGRIEIWMEGRGAGRVSTTTRRSNTQRAQPVDPALQLRNSLIQKLRRGDHL